MVVASEGIYRRDDDIALPGISLHPARRTDYQFALELYLKSTKPLLMSLGHWEKKQAIANFATNFKPRQISIIRSAGLNVGWLQVSESKSGLHLDQLHLIEAAQNRGIGTALIGKLQNRAQKRRFPLGLHVFRGNRAVNLYKRLGFEVIGEDETKLMMIWRPTGPLQPPVSG